MRWQVVVLGGAILAAAGCSSPTGPTGTVTGTYTRVGGPGGTPNMPLPGTISFRSGSGSVITVNSDSTGRFTGQLPPGTYTVTASTSLVNEGRNPCSRQLTTRVQAGKTITLALYCDIM
jgi:hypothetical protein